MPSYEAVDFANYSGIPTSEQVATWVHAGYRKAIIGTSYGTIAPTQVARCLAGGMEVAEYQWPQSFSPLLAGGECWLDVEDATPYAPNVTREQLRNICLQHPQLEGIYSSVVQWRFLMGDYRIADEFPHLKCWDANYSDDVWRPWGGFTKRDIFQHSGSVSLAGFTVDLNTCYEVPAPPAEEDEMRPKLYVTTDGKHWLVGFNAPILITSAVEVNELVTEYGPALQGFDPNTVAQMKLA